MTCWRLSLAESLARILAGHALAGQALVEGVDGEGIRAMFSKRPRRRDRQPLWASAR